MQRIFKNIASLSLLQVANYLIPLFVIPIVTRVLGAELFGRVSYAQNIVAYLTLLVNYGFDFSATRQIAISEDDKNRQRQIFWSVMTEKGLLLIVSFVVLQILACTVPRIEVDYRLYVYTALMNIGIVLFPTWYLQGIQQMEKLAVINFCIKLLGAVLVIALVQEASQYRLYPLCLSLSFVLGGLVAFIYVVRKYDLTGFTVSYESLLQTLRAGLPIFANQVCVSLYTTANMTLLGIYMADEVVGYFSGAQKIMMAVNMCAIMPISTAVFPEMSRRWEANKEDGDQFFKQVLGYAAAVGVLLSVALYVLAPWLVGLMLGKEFGESIGLLRWMAPMPCLVMIATILTVQGLYGHGLQRFAPWVGLIVGIACIGLNIGLIPLYGARSCVVNMMAAEILEIVLVSSILVIKKRSI